MKTAWDNKWVFEEQLALNIKELNSRIIPSHWVSFFKIMDSIIQSDTNYNFLDVGCGCGSYIELCKKYKNVKYKGIDFSSVGIELAQKSWGSPSSFLIMDYKELSKDCIKNVDILHLGALLDVLPDGDEAFSFILDLNPKHLIIGRVNLTDQDSSSYTIQAYAGETFIRFKHNKKKFYQELESRNLLYEKVEDTFYIKSNNLEKY